MTERDGRCDLSVAPGQVYIEVEYDYEYKAKDKLISIRQGECYMLVCKTNEDWWQVRREEGTKAFYIPAQYVREVRRALMPPPKPRAKPPNVLEIAQCRSSNENLNQRAPTERSSFGRPPPSTTPSPLPGQQTPPLLLRDTNQNSGMKSVVAELTLLNNNNYHHANPTLPLGRAESPPREQGCLRKLPDRLSVDTDGSMSPGDGLEKMRNDSESGDEFSSSSTEHMQVRISDVHSPPCSSPTLSSLFVLPHSQIYSCSPFISFNVIFGFHSLHFQHLSYYQKCSHLLFILWQLLSISVMHCSDNYY